MTDIEKRLATERMLRNDKWAARVQFDDGRFREICIGQAVLDSDRGSGTLAGLAHLRLMNVAGGTVERFFDRDIKWCVLLAPDMVLIGKVEDAPEIWSLLPRPIRGSIARHDGEVGA